MLIDGDLLTLLSDHLAQKNPWSSGGGRIADLHSVENMKYPTSHISRYIAVMQLQKTITGT